MADLNRIYQYWFFLFNYYLCFLKIAAAFFMMESAGST